MLQVFAFSHVLQSAGIRFGFYMWWPLALQGKALLARSTWTAGTLSLWTGRVLFNYSETGAVQRYDQGLTKVTIFIL